MVARFVFTAAAAADGDPATASAIYPSSPPYGACFPNAEDGLPEGYVFRPFDSEIAEFFLKTKVLCRPLPYHEFKEGIDIYLKDPEDLPINSKGRLGKWGYFFMMRDLRYNTRTTPGGYWEVVGEEEEVAGDEDERVLAFKKNLVFRRGNPPPDGEETGWEMEEFRINPELEELKKINLHRVMANFVACRIYKETKENWIPYFSDEEEELEEPHIESISREEEDLEEPQSKKPRLQCGLSADICGIPKRAGQGKC